jgi:hypothetical protein
MAKKTTTKKPATKKAKAAPKTETPTTVETVNEPAKSANIRMENNGL